MLSRKEVQFDGSMFHDTLPLPLDIIAVGFTRVVDHHTENYGADADGNRGVMTTFVDDDRAEDVYVLMGADNACTSLLSLPTELQAVVQQTVDAYLNTVEPEEDFYEPAYEPDPDDEPFDDE